MFSSINNILTSVSNPNSLFVIPSVAISVDIAAE